MLKLWFCALASPIYLHLTEWAFWIMGFHWGSVIFIIGAVISLVVIISWIAGRLEAFLVAGIKTSFAEISLVTLGWLNFMVGLWCLSWPFICPYILAWPMASHMFLTILKHKCSGLGEYFILVFIMFFTSMQTQLWAVFFLHTWCLHVIVWYIWAAPVILYIILIILEKLMN